VSTPVDGPDRCPRCGSAFACGAAAPGPCPCSTVTLDPALRARLRARFDGCLCLDCLRALAQGAPLAGPAPETAAH